MRVAVIGSGIAGLAAAHRLAPHAEVTLFEAGAWFGGHTHTVDVTLPAQGKLVTHGVDTGFLVYNERTYPQLIRLFAELDVATVPSDMSFSVRVPGAFGADALEWNGSDLNSVFCQRSNLARPRFWRMLADLLRFNKLATALAERGEDAQLAQPLGEFLDEHRFGRDFRDWYFLPMIGCIWSCPTDQMLRFPVGTMIRFCHNHGLLQVANRPQWFTVVGGARNYVQRILEGIADKRLNMPVEAVRRDDTGVEVRSAGGWERFDRVVMACHTDQSLALLADASAAERAVLGAIRYQPNRAVLHTDTSLLPQRRAAWAAWNYERTPEANEAGRVCLHYLLNKLQPLPWTQPVICSLNPAREPDERHVVGAWEYAHPVFDAAAITAQRELLQIQRHRHTWFAGAWAGYGFHEDGLKAGLAAAQDVLASLAPQEALA